MLRSALVIVHVLLLVLLTAVPPLAASNADQKSVAEWLGDLLDDDPKVRALAASGLGRKGDEAAVAVPALAKLLEDEAVVPRANAACALGRIGPKASAAVPALVKAMEADPESAVRIRAAVALGAIGPDASEAIPALEKALKRENVRVHAPIAGSIWRIKGESPEMLALLTHLLEVSDADTRAAAARALQEVGPAAKDAVAPLAIALFDEDAVVRKTAADALAHIGVSNPDVIESLEFAELDDVEAVSKAATQALTALRGQGEKGVSGAGAADDAAPDRNRFEALAAGESVALSCAIKGQSAESGRITLKIRPGSGGGTEVAGDLEAEITENPYYSDSQVVHELSASFSGVGQESGDAKWVFGAQGRYTERTTSEDVDYETEGELRVEFSLSDDGAVVGVVCGAVTWPDLVFDAPPD